VTLIDAITDRQPNDLESVPCNLCGQDIPKTLFHIGRFRIVECGGCQLVYTSPRLRLESLKSIYNQSYFQSPNSLVHGYDDYQKEKPSIQKTFRQRWNRIRKLSGDRPGRLLDVGCALGYLLDIARCDGWETKGLDTSQYAVQYARETLQLDVAHSDLTHLPFPDEHFNVITLWDVIEHLPDPTRTIRECFQKLKPGGLLSIITPDQSSLCARLLGKRWVEYQKPHEHIYFFSTSNFAELLRRIGFHIEWKGTAGKHVPLGFALERLCSYQPTVFGALHRLTKTFRIDSINLKINPGDKMSLIARRPAGAPTSRVS